MITLFSFFSIYNFRTEWVYCLDIHSPDILFEYSFHLNSIKWIPPMSRVQIEEKTINPKISLKLIVMRRELFLKAKLAALNVLKNSILFFW